MTGTGSAVQAIETPPETDRSGGPPVAELLESWKDIAGYLRRDIRTVQRWEKILGLPVHRVHNSKSGSVFAYKGEIDNWRRERMLKVARDRLPSLVEASPSQTAGPGEVPWRRNVLPLTALLIGILLGVGITVIAQYAAHYILSPDVVEARK